MADELATNTLKLESLVVPVFWVHIECDRALLPDFRHAVNARTKHKHAELLESWEGSEVTKLIGVIQQKLKVNRGLPFTRRMIQSCLLPGGTMPVLTVRREIESTSFGNHNQTLHIKKEQQSNVMQTP